MDLTKLLKPKNHIKIKLYSFDGGIEVIIYEKNKYPNYSVIYSLISWGKLHSECTLDYEPPIILACTDISTIKSAIVQMKSDNRDEYDIELDIKDMLINAKSVVNN